MAFFRIIQTSSTGVLQTFGKSAGTIGPGIRLFIPLVQNITPVSNRIQQESFEFETKTKDNVFVKLGIVIQHQIKPEDTEVAFFSLDDPVKQIYSYVENVVRAKVPQMLLDELFESQDDICQSVSENLQKIMSEYGFTIVNTLLTNIEPSQAVKDAMNKINASERLKEAAKK